MVVSNAILPGVFQKSVGMGDLSRIWNRSTGGTCPDSVEEKVVSDVYVLPLQLWLASSSN